MGVPAFFRWLTRKYPSIVIQCAEEKQKKNDFTDEKIPVDTSQPNPNGVEFDNLYLDMNGIIHPCTHPEDRPAPKNEEEMMLIIFEFIDRIFSIVRPRKVLYMAIDGVAPRAKMNQQRSRRFRAAKDNYEKASEIKRLKEQIISNGGSVPGDKPDSEKFDSNCITPGTPFMHKLAHCLRYYVHDRLNNDPGWKNIVVMLSDANVPGEGEHKIMDYIRRQRANPDHDPNTHHVLCGADADLIMLGLATHEPYFTIIREEFKPNQPRPCEICNQFGHESKECTGLAREKSGAYDEMANSVVVSETNYIFLRLSILKEYLSRELSCISNNSSSFKFDLERAIDDWVFMCFFVGNDFLPHLPSLEIRENAIDRLVNLYKSMINQAGGYLTDCGNVNLSRVQFILTGIGEVEDDIFKKRQKTETEFRNRRKHQNKRNMRMGQDMPSQMPNWMKTGPYAPTPLGKKPNPVQTSNKFELMEDKSTESEDQRGIKRKAIEEAAASSEKINPDEIQIDDEVKEVKEEPVPERKEPVEEDEDANDQVRLWEDGWKDRYYKVKFDVAEDDIEFRQKVARHYVIGLQWVLKYYYQGVPSWGWYFPYHYAPFASDFTDIIGADCEFNEVTKPFDPFDQLMAVFPAGSKQHVPIPWQILMTDINSPIIDFYPEDFQVDLNGKKQSWQGVALLPFVDERRLKKALEPMHEKLNKEEKKRNTMGNDCLFVRKTNDLYDFLVQIYDQNGNEKYKKFNQALDIDTSVSNGIAGKIWCDEYVCLEDETYKSPLGKLTPDLPKNKVISVHYHDPVYDESEKFWSSKILPGAVVPEPTLKPGDFDNRNSYRPNLGFNKNNDYRNNKNPSVANRFIQNSLSVTAEIGSSANGGHGSVYGTYRTSSYSNNSNNNYNNNRNGGNSNGQGYNNQRGNYQGQGYNNRANNNNNYNDNGNNYNNSRNGSYGNRGGNNYNSRGGNNNFRGDNQNNNYNESRGNGQNYNNQRGGYNNGRGGYNNGRGGGSQNYNYNNNNNNMQQ